MKLRYFQGRGRVETARLMLELTRTPYEIEGVPLEEWMGPEGKPRALECTPFGQLPTLEVGTMTLCQSQAINRYIARKVGLFGETPEEAARIDEVAETALELILDFALYHWAPDFHERRPAHREATQGRLALLDAYFARKRPDPEHWVVRERYTYADVIMAYALETTLPVHPGLLETFPALHRSMTAFFATSGVREYVRSARRPRTWTIHLAKFAGCPEETHHWID